MGTKKLPLYPYYGIIYGNLRICGGGDELLAAYGYSENPFSDVDLEAWYAPYVVHTYYYGVIHGYGDGTFGPANEVTYAEFLKIATLFQNLDNAVALASELES